MNNYIRISILCLFCLSQGNLIAQQEIKLNINHMLGEQVFQTDVISENNIGQAFNAYRMQYYLSGFRIIHDGGQETELTDIYVLANADEEEEYSLGLATFTNIETIKFKVGVDSLNNHSDPSTWPADHPLAPQNPDTHWGWASGYRFVMIEGNGGIQMPSFTFEIHALGDQHYRGDVSVNVYPEDMGTYTRLSINADYDRALDGINVSSGLFNHGFDDEAEDIISNMKLYVFSEVDELSSIIESEFNSSSLSILANPVHSNQILFQYHAGDYRNLSLRLTDYSGRIISEKTLTDLEGNDLISAPTQGAYILSLFTSNDLLRSSNVIVTY